jgi:hypothetical protein
MSNEGYHEPIPELTDATRDMHRAIASTDGRVGGGGLVEPTG